MNVIITCDVDVLNDVEDVVVVDLAPPLGLEDVVHGAPDLASLRHHLPARAPMSVRFVPTEQSESEPSLRLCSCSYKSTRSQEFHMDI